MENGITPFHQKNVYLFRNIYLVKVFLNNGDPVISVDCKKKDNIGNFKNAGREWTEKNNPSKVKVYDFIDKDLGKAIPYGVYDIQNNEGFVNVVISHDTASFAVASIRGNGGKRWGVLISKDQRKY